MLRMSMVTVAFMFLTVGGPIHWCLLSLKQLGFQKKKERKKNSCFQQTKSNSAWKVTILAEVDAIELHFNGAIKLWCQHVKSASMICF